MKPRIAVVTNTLPHHKFWIAEMCRLHNVVCVLHPHPEHKKQAGGIIKNKGLWYALLLALTRVYYVFSKSNSRKEFKAESEKWFSEAAREYNDIDKSKIFNVTTVNSTESKDIILKNEVDIICFLGGDIARKEFIGSAKIACLNFHSGISPVYNGSKSYLWPVAENRPNLVGGTLMLMNEKIDGGEIISQFLPEITGHDNASSLFMKTVIGSVALFSSAIHKAEIGEKLSGIKQERSIRYTKSADWTLYQEIQLASFYKSGNMKRYIRESKIVEPADAKNEKLFVSECLVTVLSTKQPNR